MTRLLMTLALMGVSAAAQASEANTSRAHSVNPVVTWNRILLSIVRTPGASRRQFIPRGVLPFCTRRSTTPSTPSIGRTLPTG